ncbi:MAG: hypothetical protein U5O39_06365 [Gammaproteobacteria bacterium]|nr:hypothetical protein [Gammaproteobacteria bacterium]
MARQDSQLGAVTEPKSATGPKRRVVVAIIFVASARNIGSLVGDMARAKREAACTRFLVNVNGGMRGAETAGFDTGARVTRSRAWLRDDVDHSGKRVAAPERALRTANDFDTLDIARHDVSEVEFVALGQVIRLDTVD